MSFHGRRRHGSAPRHGQCRPQRTRAHSPGLQRRPPLSHARRGAHGLRHRRYDSHQFRRSERRPRLPALRGDSLQRRLAALAAGLHGIPRRLQRGHHRRLRLLAGHHRPLRPLHAHTPQRADTPDALGQLSGAHLSRERPGRDLGTVPLRRLRAERFGDSIDDLAHRHRREPRPPAAEPRG